MSGDGKRSDLSVETAPVLDSTSLMRMSERDARGPEDDDKPSLILGGSASSPVENWSGAPPVEEVSSSDRNSL
jgi:hypothetical protein